LKESVKDFETIKYLENPPTFEELMFVLKKLNYKPIALLRQKESICMENFKGKN
jgi:arsenate reductase